MKKVKFKSDVFEAIHSIASGLAQVGVIDDQTMCKYDDMCIVRPDPTDLVEVGNHQVKK